MNGSNMFAQTIFVFQNALAEFAGCRFWIQMAVTVVSFSTGEVAKSHETFEALHFPGIFDTLLDQRYYALFSLQIICRYLKIVIGSESILIETWNQIWLYRVLHNNKSLGIIFGSKWSLHPKWVEPCPRTPSPAHRPMRWVRNSVSSATGLDHAGPAYDCSSISWLQNFSGKWHRQISCHFDRCNGFL